MDYHLFKESPFKTLISFHKLIEALEKIADTNVDYRSNYAKALLKEIEPFPEFRTGIENLNLIPENETLINYLLADLFPTALTQNEIKAVTIPFQNFTFNYSERFKKILENAGRTFDMTIRDFDQNQFYIMNCILILNSFYNQHFDFNRPLFYDIPDANGNAFPKGIAIRFQLPDGGYTDIVSISTNGFPAAKPEDFLGLLNAVAASVPITVVYTLVAATGAALKPPQQSHYCSV